MFSDISYRDITVKDFNELEIKTKPLKKKKNRFLKRIWATYGHLSGYQLELLTQSEIPWLEQRWKTLSLEFSSNLIGSISPTTMAKYYRQLYMGTKYGKMFWKNDYQTNL